MLDRSYDGEHKLSRDNCLLWTPPESVFETIIDASRRDVPLAPPPACSSIACLAFETGA